MELKCVTIQMKAFERCFDLVLLIILYKIILTSESVKETLVCDHSNERYREVLSLRSVYYVVERCSYF